MAVSPVNDRLEDLLLLIVCHYTKEHYKKRHERHCLQKCVGQLCTNPSVQALKSLA